MQQRRETETTPRSTPWLDLMFQNEAGMRLASWKSKNKSKNLPKSRKTTTTKQNNTHQKNKKTKKPKEAQQLQWYSGKNTTCLLLINILLDGQKEETMKEEDLPVRD